MIERSSIFAAVVLLGTCLPNCAYPQSAAEVQMMKSAETHAAFISKFVQLMKEGKEEEVLAALDPASVRGIPPEQIIRGLKGGLFPFFSDYKEVKRYEQVTKAQVPDGRVGLWHYTFIVDNQGNVKPFQIAVIDTEAGLRVLSIDVGQCVRGRHPPIPPCQ